MREDQELFNRCIGELDHVISRLMIYSKQCDRLNQANRQTLKHHAEDMIAAGRKMEQHLIEFDRGTTE